MPAVADFLEMWEKVIRTEFLEKGLRCASDPKGDRIIWFRPTRLSGIVRTVIRGIERVEKASARFIQQQAADPKTAERISALVEEGYDEGSAYVDGRAREDGR